MTDTLDLLLGVSAPVLIIGLTFVWVIGPLFYCHQPAPLLPAWQDVDDNNARHDAIFHG